MKERKFEKKWLLFAGLILIAFSIATTILLISLRNHALWAWYDEIQLLLFKVEAKIEALGMTWQFIATIMLLYAIKSFIPIYSTSTVCLASGAVLPLYLSIPVNMVGFVLQTTIKYYWGKKFGAGYAWKLMQKNTTLRNAMEASSSSSHYLLFALRIVPGVPVNTFSAIYGSTDFGFRKFTAISLVGFLPKIISFSLAGTFMFNPLSAGFLLPIIVITFASGVSCLGANGIWTAVEFVSNFVSKREADKAALENKYQEMKERKKNHD